MTIMLVNNKPVEIDHQVGQTNAPEFSNMSEDEIILHIEKNNSFEILYKNLKSNPEKIKSICQSYSIGRFHKFKLKFIPMNKSTLIKLKHKTNYIINKSESNNIVLYFLNYKWNYYNDLFRNKFPKHSEFPLGNFIVKNLYPTIAILISILSLIISIITLIKKD
jgi:hypothetical protein